MSEKWMNWSGWQAAWPESRQKVASETDLVTAMKHGAAPVRVAGSGHSFTALVPTSGSVLTLEGLSGVVSADAQTKEATVRAGTTISALGPLLHEHGLALVNQGDIDRQAIAGAVGTGTHGTGRTLGCLSSAVTGFRLATASGDVLDCSADENADVFTAGRVALGSLGVMSEITLQCRESYGLEESGGRMKLDAVLSDMDALIEENRHFEFFWFPHSREVLVKTLNEAPLPERPPYGPRGPRKPGTDEKAFRLACEIDVKAPGLSALLQKTLTRASGSRYSGALTKPRKARYSFEAFPSEREIRFNEMEYAVPLEAGPDCVRDVAAAMRRSGEGFVFPIEYRTCAQDDIWLSPFYGRESATIAVHQYAGKPYQALFAAAESVFRAYDGRPHWGKLHTRTAEELAALYPRWDEFQTVRRRLDPDGRLLNPYLSALFGESGKKAQRAA